MPSIIKIEIKRQCCESMQSAIDRHETGIIYISKFDEYGIHVEDGGSSHLVLNYCPWCGNKLPQSRRLEWFKQLEELGIDFTKDVVPASFQSDAWYVQRRDTGV
jgi:hypothetical protein